MDDATLPTRQYNGRLSEIERRWSDQYDFLRTHGLELRSRYSPDWNPTWPKTGNTTYEREHYDDGPPASSSGFTLDAKDRGQPVLLKMRTLSHRSELDVLEYLNDHGRRQLAGNHCVQVLRRVGDPVNDIYTFLVMPLLRNWDDPRFATVGEVVGFLKQVFDGLRFMHSQHIVYGGTEIMMEANEGLYPEMFHPNALKRTVDLKRRAPHTTRTRAPPKYYYTDFSYSSQGETDLLKYQDDIARLGDMIDRQLLDRYDGLEFLQPLIKTMTKQVVSEERLTSDQVVGHFRLTYEGLSDSKLRSRLIGKDEFAIACLYRNIRHGFRTRKDKKMGFNSIPAP